jgi:hypothetical protein
MISTSINPITSTMATGNPVADMAVIAPEKPKGGDNEPTKAPPEPPTLSDETWERFERGLPNRKDRD